MSRQTLADQLVGTTARVARVPDSDPGLLRYLSELGLLPGASVAIVRRDPYGGPLYVDVKGRTGDAATVGPQIIGQELASRIFIERLDDVPRSDRPIASPPG